MAVHTRWKLGLWRFGFLVAVSLPTLSRAGVEYYDVRVDGLACPFCAYGLEKKLTALAGVTEVHIDLDAGRVAFAVTGTDVVWPERVREAILAAGFTPRAFTIRATGSLLQIEGRLVLDLGAGRRLELTGERSAALAVGDDRGPRRVRIEGALDRRPDGTWTLTATRVQSFEAE